MIKTSYIFLSIFLFTCSLLAGELFYMYSLENNKKIKEDFVHLSGLPDLAVSNEAHFIRHRSYADTFSLFANSPELLEYFPSTFVYNHPNTNNPSKITHE
jgi:hypothetical protein